MMEAGTARAYLPHVYDIPHLFGLAKMENDAYYSSWLDGDVKNTKRCILTTLVIHLTECIWV